MSAPQRILQTILSTSDGDVGGDRAVADIGVDLDEEIAADGHRFALGVVDIVGDDRTAPRHFIADEFGRDIIGDFRAKALAVADIFLQPRTAQIFALRHIFHFGRNDAAPGIVHLADVHAGFGAQHLFADIGERRDTAAAVGAELAIVFGADFALEHLLDITAFADPCAADFGQARADVDARIGIGIGTARVS